MISPTMDQAPSRFDMGQPPPPPPKKKKKIMIMICPLPFFFKIVRNSSLLKHTVVFCILSKPCPISNTNPDLLHQMDTIKTRNLLKHKKSLTC